MFDRNTPEISYLLKEVENKYGSRVATSADFDHLSNAILESTHNMISASTLKRLWGYVSLSPMPRSATLDILTQYLGFKDFRTFCDDLIKRNIVESGFFSSKYLAVSDLIPGQSVQIGWAPNRMVMLSYLGNFEFEVVESVNSKLEQGDRFELSSIMVGYPLYIPRIMRNGNFTPSYIAGRNTGITSLVVE